MGGLHWFLLEGFSISVLDLQFNSLEGVYYCFCFGQGQKRIWPFSFKKKTSYCIPRMTQPTKYIPAILYLSSSDSTMYLKQNLSYLCPEKLTCLDQQNEQASRFYELPYNQTRHVICFPDLFYIFGTWVFVIRDDNLTRSEFWLDWPDSNFLGFDPNFRVLSWDWAKKLRLDQFRVRVQALTELTRPNQTLN